MGRGKLGGAHGIREQMVTQFQSEVPDPLGNDLPTLLTPGGMAAPTVGLLLAIFIAECIFKRATMQIECDHIGSGEGSLWQRCQEQFIDDPITLDAHPMLFRSCGMSRHHDPTALLAWAHQDIRAVIEGTDVCTFRTAELLIGGKEEPKLDLGQRKHLIVFATHDHRESSNVREGDSGPIESVEPQQHGCYWQLMGHQVLLDLGHGSA
jgi:hypothetical protein